MVFQSELNILFLFWKTWFWIPYTHSFCYFWGEFCDPNFEMLSSWKLFQKSWSFTYFNFRIFGVELSGTMAWFSDRVKLPWTGISVMFSHFWFYTSFSVLHLEMFPSWKLLRTSFSITCINLGIFRDHFDSRRSLIWETRILFQRTIFSLSLSY